MLELKSVVLVFRGGGVFFIIFFPNFEYLKKQILSFLDRLRENLPITLK